MCPGAETPAMIEIFVDADIGLSLPCREALASFWQFSLWKGACFVVVMLHYRRTFLKPKKNFPVS